MKSTKQFGLVKTPILGGVRYSVLFEPITDTVLIVSQTVGNLLGLKYRGCWAFCPYKGGHSKVAAKPAGPWEWTWPSRGIRHVSEEVAKIPSNLGWPLEIGGRAACMMIVDCCGLSLEATIESEASEKQGSASQGDSIDDLG